jgi:hypothetical protein
LNVEILQKSEHFFPNMLFKSYAELACHVPFPFLLFFSTTPHRLRFFEKIFLPRSKKFLFIPAPRRKSHHIIARMAELVDALD